MVLLDFCYVVFLVPVNSHPVCARRAATTKFSITWHIAFHACNCCVSTPLSQNNNIYLIVSMSNVSNTFFINVYIFKHLYYKIYFSILIYIFTYYKY
jgi:hypothetical protein